MASGLVDPADLRALLSALAPAGLLIIDGNNFLYRQSPRYGSHAELDFPAPRHRQALIEDAADAVRAQCAGARLDLWFDGPEFRCEHPVDGLRVIDSGGKGKDRADRRILDFLRTEVTVRSLSSSVLLTHDKGLAKRARRWVRVA